MNGKTLCDGETMKKGALVFGVFVVVLVMAAMTVSAVQLSDNISAYWTMNASGSFLDEIDANDGTLNGPTYTSSGFSGGAYIWDNISDEVVVNDSSSFRDGNLTINFWFKGGSAPSGYDYLTDVAILGKGNITVPGSYSINYVTTSRGNPTLKASFIDTTGAKITSLQTFTKDVWIMVTVVYNESAASVRTYVNGVAGAAAVVGAGMDLNTTGDFNIGHPAGAVFYMGDAVTDGTVDELAVWERTMDASEVLGLYNSGAYHPLSEFIPAAPPVSPAVPAWVAPTPADGAVNSTQVVLNASCAAGLKYYVWFDGSNPPSTLVLSNSSSGEYATNVTAGTYYYRAACYNASSGLFSANSTVRNWTYVSTDITQCGDITSPGNYTLTQDVVYDAVTRHSNGSDFCLYITASNVTLDCVGYSINLTNYNDTNVYPSTVLIDGVGAVVKNCVFNSEAAGQDYLYPSSIVVGGDGGVFQNNTFYNMENADANSAGTSLSATSASGIIYENNTDYEGASFALGGANIIRGNIFYNNPYYALAFAGTSNNNMIYDNVWMGDAGGSGMAAIYLRAKDSLGGAPQNNTFYNNIFNITNAGYDIQFVNSSYTGSEYQNNFDNGSIGNLWLTNATNNMFGPYSETCVDANSDGICDDPIVTLVGTDNYALALVPGQNIPSLVVTGDAPVNNTQLTSVESVFNFTLSDGNGSETCDLYIDNVGVNESVGLADGSYSFTAKNTLISLNDDQMHQWKVVCNATSSVTRTFIVNDVNYPILIYGCGILDYANATYLLQNNITVTDDYCFNVTAANVSFDMNGYTITNTFDGTENKVFNIQNSPGMILENGSYYLNSTVSSLDGYFVFAQDSSGLIVKDIMVDYDVSKTNSVFNGHQFIRYYGTSSGQVLNVSGITGNMPAVFLYRVTSSDSYSIAGDVRNVDVVSVSAGNFFQTSGGFHGGMSLYNVTTTNMGIDENGRHTYDASGPGFANIYDSHIDGSVTLVGLRTVNVLNTNITGSFSHRNYGFYAGGNIINSTILGTAYKDRKTDVGTIYNNYFGGTLTLGGQVILLNTTRQNGTRPNGLPGTEIGGNYYGALQSGCVDVDRDYFCDDPMSVGGSTDYLAYAEFRELFTGAANVTSPQENDAVRGENVTVNVVLDDENYEGIVLRVDNITQNVTGVQNGSNVTFIVPVSPGDRVLSVGAYDLSGQGLTNWTNIDLRVSNLGTIENVTSDKSVYWITNEDPYVSWELSNSSGYGPLAATVSLMNGSMVIASQSAESVDNHTYNVSFNESVVTSYDTAHFKIDMTDTLFNESANTSNIVVDALTEPVVTGPSSVQYGDFNVTWNASTENLGTPVYTVQQSLNGGGFSLVNTTTNSYLPITADFEGNVTYQVKAEDDYVNTTYNTGSEFAIVLSPDISSEVCAALTYPNEDNLPTPAKVPVNFSVFAPIGFSSPVVDVRLKFGGNEFTDDTCTYVQTDSKHRDYTCNVSMNYWYAPEDYNLNITFTDASKESSIEVAGACTYGQLIAAKRTVDAIGFSSAAPGVQDALSDSPMVVRNTGNVAVNLHVTGYDLTGRSTPATKLLASDFKAGATLLSSVQLGDGVQKDVSMSIVPGENASDEVWLWLSMPQGQLIQDYYAASPWEIVGTG